MLSSGNIYVVKVEESDSDGNPMFSLLPDQPATDKSRALKAWWEDDGPDPSAGETYMFVQVKQVMAAERKLVFRSIGGKKRGRKAANPVDDDDDDDMDELDD
tara:strand:+ start:4724 stop:5029 length:306 start_codon:yes stop_codon:yes gene_type:complete